MVVTCIVMQCNSTFFDRVDGELVPACSSGVLADIILDLFSTGGGCIVKLQFCVSTYYMSVDHTRVMVVGRHAAVVSRLTSSWTWSQQVRQLCSNKNNQSL
jgi:hypothetical protein